MPDINLGIKKSAIKKTAEEMESWPFNAQHTGAINHAHSFHFDEGVLTAFKEIRLAVTIIVGGWVVVTAIRTLESSLRDRGGGGSSS